MAKTAIVTGAGAGIGKAIGIALASNGFEVVFADIDEEKAAEAVRSLGRGEAHCVDVTRSEDVDRLLSATHSRFGSIDLIVNNAGVVFQGPTSEMTDEQWSKVLDVNLSGTFRMCRSAVPFLKTTRGKIVNISSWVGKTGRKYHAAYCASKFGIIGFTQALALELAEFGITVNAVLPGTIAGTDMLAKTDAWAREQGWPVSSERAQSIPMGRLGTADDIAAAVTYLASSAADFITGHSLNVSGGAIMT